MDNFEGFKTSSVEKVTANVAEIARELEVKSEEVTELMITKQAFAVNEWEKKVFSLDVIYSGWRCCEGCWNDNKGFRILYQFSW